MIDNPFVSPKAVALFVLGFFIYLNFKFFLFKKFVEYGKIVMRVGKKPVPRKKNISEYEMKASFEDSAFKRVSQLNYSKDMVKNIYSMSGKSVETGTPLPPRKDCVFLKKVIVDDDEEMPKFQIKIKR